MTDFFVEVPIAWRADTGCDEALMVGGFDDTKIIVDGYSHVGYRIWVGVFIGRQVWAEGAFSIAIVGDRYGVGILIGEDVLLVLADAG